MAHRDPVTEQACPACGATLVYLSHLDGGRGGARFNVLLWKCSRCAARYSATTDLTDPEARASVVPEPWPADRYWPG